MSLGDLPDAAFGEDGAGEGLRVLLFTDAERLEVHYDGELLLSRGELRLQVGRGGALSRQRRGASGLRALKGRVVDGGCRKAGLASAPLFGDSLLEVGRARRLRAIMRDRRAYRAAHLLYERSKWRSRGNLSMVTSAM